MFTTLKQDIPYGARLFLRRPAFSAIVVLTLALGIGVNAAVFSIASAFLWKPVSFEDLDHLVMLLELAPQRTDYWNSVAPANYEDWKDQVTFAKDLAAFAWKNATLTGGSEPERVQAFRVSPNFFAVLGVYAAKGRTFQPGEDVTGHEQEVIISNGLWQRRFGSSPEIINSTIELNGGTYTVIGVMPRDFNFPLTADLWVPLAMDPGERADRGKHSLVVFGRLKPGVSLEQARAQMDSLTLRLDRAYPLTNKGWGSKVMPIREFVNGSLTRQFTLLLVGAVGFVLLIVCVNVTNLQLVFSTARRQEIAVRMAVGASYSRMVRQLVTESMLLALAGGVLSLGLAQLALKALLAHVTGDMRSYLAGWDHIRLDAAAFGFILVLALAAGILSGAAPALSCRDANLNDGLREGARTSSNRNRRYARSAFVVMQIAFSLVLLFGAAIMTKSFLILSNLHRRFAPQTILTMRINLDSPQYRDPQRMLEFYDQATQNLQALPGVKSAALATSIPFANNPRSVFFEVEGRDSGEGHPSAVLQSTSAGYFATLGFSLLEGRTFSDSDNLESANVVIISRNLAHRFWPNESALGKRLRLDPAKTESPWRTVVGIVEDVHYDWTDPGPEMAIYLPYHQFPLPASFIVLRSSGTPSGLYSVVRGKVASIDPQTPIAQMRSLDQVIADSVLGLGFMAVLIGVLGFIGLVLAGLGVYGIMAQTVNEQLHEVGVRMALGAQPSDILRLILSRGGVLTVAGAMIGMAMSMALARLLTGMIAGIAGIEASILLGSSAFLSGISIFACYVPARKASVVDPKEVLYSE